MGNKPSIPESSDDEWVVIPAIESCFSGKVRIPLDGDEHYSCDSRLVYNAASRENTENTITHATATTGIPKHEYDNKIVQFNSIVGRGRKIMTLIQWSGIAIIIVLPLLLRSYIKDIEEWKLVVSAVIPLILTAGYILRYAHIEKKRVTEEIFGDWKERFQIIDEVDYYYGHHGGKGGGRYEAPRVGFKLSKSVVCSRV